MRRASMCCVNDENGNNKTKTTTTTNSSTKHRRNSCTGKSTITKKLHLVPKNSVNEGIVEEFIKCINKQDVNGCTALLKSPQQCEWRFSGEVNITIKQYGEMIQNIVRSFPDFSIAFKEVVEVGPGVVQVKHAIASGTHTGEPFGFQCYQPLEATGFKCINDPEHLTFFIIDGKIIHVHVVCTGEHCGPVGLHKQSKNGASASAATVRSPPRRSSIAATAA